MAGFHLLSLFGVLHLIDNLPCGLVTGILICNMEGEYRGAARFSSIPDYYENDEIGPALQEFVAECVDPETQEIIYRLNNIPKALAVSGLINISRLRQ